MSKSFRCYLTCNKINEWNLGPVHTSAFLFETAYISMLLGLLSTLRRWAFSAKPRQCENALESASKWKCIRIRCESGSAHNKTLSVFGVTENEAKWKRICVDIALVWPFCAREVFWDGAWI